MYEPNELDERALTRLFKEVIVHALRVTQPTEKKTNFMNADRARNAVQRLYERYRRVQPEVETYENLKGYLMATVIREIQNADEQERARGRAEARAAAHADWLGAHVVRSHEEELRARETERETRERAERMERRLRELLVDDRVAIGTIDAFKAGHETREAQAAFVGVTEEDIKNARRRRERAVAIVREEEGRWREDAVPAVKAAGPAEENPA